MNPYVESLKRVWESTNFKPQYVFINYESLEKAALRLAGEEFKAPSWRGEVFPEKDDDTFIDFVIVSGSLLYCTTDFSTGKRFDIEYPKGKIQTGSFAVHGAIKRAMDEGINILDPRVLAKLDLGEVYYIFRCMSTPIPMMESRWRQLKQLGQDSFGRSFSEEFKFLNLYETVKCVEHLTIQYARSYQDISYWPALDDLSGDEPGAEEFFFEFNKRAQLVPMIYHGRALSSNGALPLLKDPEKIGPLAEYRVEQTLRHYGVIRYSDELARLVDNGIEVPKDTRMEVEARLQTVQALCKILERINALRAGMGLSAVTMVELDYPLFIFSRRMEIPQRHRYTYTTAY